MSMVGRPNGSNSDCEFNFFDKTKLLSHSNWGKGKTEGKT
jgi:hypothetical protein